MPIPSTSIRTSPIHTSLHSYVPLTGGEWTKWSWYFQPAARLDTHNTYLLQRGLGGYNRAKTVGFRCLKDAPRAQD